MQHLKRMTWIFLAICIPMIHPTGPATASEATEAFGPGEKLTFRLRWGFIPAGKAVLEVKPFAEINGEKAYHFVLTTKTNALIDAFYRFRQRIDAYTDLNLNHSLLYREVYTMNQRKRDATLSFDWDTGQARYCNLGKKRAPITLLPGSFDPLSVFYFSRLFNLEKNREIERPVTDGKKNVIGRARVLRRETVTVPCGTYDTYLIEPDLRDVGGVFEKDPRAKIQLWVSADHRKIPVLLRSKVVIGSFVGELCSER